VGAFGWRIKDCGVLGRFYLYNPVFFGYQREFGHAVGAGEMRLPWDDAVVCNYGWLIERFLAALVGASEFLLVLAPVPREKLHLELPPVSIKYRVY
jgi:hypothetical protein